jgi:hypothetical protein
MAILELTHPIENIDGTPITEIKIKEITGGLYLRLGPVTIPEVQNDGMQYKIRLQTNMQTLSRYLQELTGLPEAILKRLSVTDIIAAQGIIDGFLSPKHG